MRGSWPMVAHGIQDGMGLRPCARSFLRLCVLCGSPSGFRLASGRANLNSRPVPDLGPAEVHPTGLPAGAAACDGIVFALWT